ncbi:hypothetical protein BC833DRAFT_201431 [Globomyces pollinis-pini]|nr:hypothetical protein BC833DRAFT_201431 [Globomyces pollinis-pini]
MNPNRIQQNDDYSHTNGSAHSRSLSNQSNTSQLSHLSLLESKLINHGPYVRVYKEKGVIKDQQIDRKVKPEQQPAVSYTSISDIQSTASKQLSKHSYPSVIKAPAGFTKLVDSPISVTGRTNRSYYSASAITLSRPKSQGPRYSRSASGSSTLSSNVFPISSKPLDPSQPLLPFLHLTNALQLHLKLRVLDDERIISWIPGSYLTQPSPFYIEPQKSLFSFKNDSSQEINLENIKPSLHYPGYLLLTNKTVYILRPTFRLMKLSQPLPDEQTSYFNPSKLIQVCYKAPLKELGRIDVGPGRQYLVFHSRKTTEIVKKNSETNNPNILSVMFQTRSRLHTTQVIDSITTVIHEEFDGQTGSNFLAPIQAQTLINQDCEWSFKALQEMILLKPGAKAVDILSYDWDKATLRKLSNEEFDHGIEELVTKVDFNFIKLYVFGVVLRYFQPVLNTNVRGLEIQHITLFGTRDYLYVLQERLDIWPPSIFPPGFINERYNNFTNESQQYKGLMTDMITQYQTLGVGRIKDITRIERWRSWRIDESFQDFQGLGRCLQNGHIGYWNESVSHLKQQSTTSGWFWWIRIVYGSREDQGGPMLSPQGIPESGYFWDVVFSSRESADDVVEMISKLHEGVVVVIGDD